MFDFTSAAVAIAVVYLLFSNHRLKQQLAEIQKQLQDFMAAGAPGATVGATVGATAGQAVGQAGDPPETDQAGPWAQAKGATVAPTLRRDGARKDARKSATRPQFFVFRAQNWSRARTWLAENWFLAVAALSLALSGVFLVQYGVENGVLSPFWRVMGAVALGVALIVGGEFVRRRWGDGRADHTAYLPSTFAGAGLVVLFAAALSARALYGLIGAETALVWLVAVSGVAVVLGWFYGPYLAVVGILGSVAAPFLVGGESASPELFYYYFALIAVVALLVDAIKRWAWVSALALLFTFGAALMIYAGGADAQHFLAFGLIATVAAIALPALSVWPGHDGATVSVWLAGFLRVFGKGKDRTGSPEFPTRVAGATFVGAGAIALLVALDGAGAIEVWLAIVTLCILYLLATIWCRRAPALADLAVLPPVLVLGVVVLQAFDFGPLFGVFEQGLARGPEMAPPAGVSVLTGIGLAGAAIAHWRGLWRGQLAQVWSGGAALLAPLMLVVLEFWWAPVGVLGAALWAAHGIIIAAVMVFFAGQVARRDGEDKRRVAYYALAALTMIAFALVVILSSAALTVALAVMVLGAALMDRRLGLPLLCVFVQVGVIVIGWRLVIAPGIFWAEGAPIWEVLLAYLGSAGLMYAAWRELAQRRRASTRITVESGIWATLGVLASVLLNRALGSDFDSHWGLSLFGSIWLLLMCVQIYRLRAGGVMGWVRRVLAVIYGLVATLVFALIAIFANPLAGPNEPVVGLPVFDSLLVAFGVPALVLAIGVWKMPGMRRWLRLSFVVVSAGFAACYVALEIRRLWRGPDLSVPGTSDGELYSYTVALLLISVALLFFAFSRRSLPLRRIATVGIGLTIAKVFVIDMAGLAGLLRVVSFLGLGLSLAGLGWVSRRMASQWDRGDATN